MKKESPMLFSTPMVIAIDNDTKTNTRRILKIQPDENGVSYMKNPPLNWEQIYNEEWKPWYFDTEQGERITMHCPYGEIGDLLWVRETWAYRSCNTSTGKVQIEYAATPGERFSLYPKKSARVLLAPVGEKKKWMPNIFLSKEAARIWLEIIDIKVERLQDINEQDAIAEGVIQNRDGSWHDYLAPERLYQDDAKGSFISLWQSINGAESWKQNPWVWVIKFKKYNGTELK